MHKKYPLLMMTLMLFFYSISANAHNLPDLGSPGLVIYDRQTEIELGRAFTQALHNDVDLIKDPQVLSYVRRIGHRIAEHAQDNRNYRFYVIDDDAINAFAGPDGIIGIHKGLILAADTEDELASVIAHEIAHVTQQHLARRFEQQSSLNVTSFASLLAAILIGTQNPGAGVAALMGATGLSMQEQLRHSRIHEHEADHIGITLLQKAGYDPHAMAHFFGKLAKQQQIYEFRPPEILMTHPVTETRLAQATHRASQLSKTQHQHDPLNLGLIQLRLNPKRATLQSRTGLLSTLECYQQTLNAHKQQNTPCLSEALNTHPNNRLLKLKHIRQQQGLNPNRAVSDYAKLIELYPQDEAILLLFAQAYRTLGQEENAQTLIISHLDNKRYKYALYQELSQSFSSQQRLAEAYLFEAFAYFDLGNLQRAQHLLMQSKRTHRPIANIYQKTQQQLATQIKPNKN
ncbi:M48 family metalloprotease [Thiomicrospira microaerophila]|uniref:M48 family metalloprotease n=1 Tax=Thiomicrospira microaerophila TaxID=406020 RepID=UPI000696A377|nr:M48 family metalloprotease [Thiomicrospira microaerophila]